MLLTVCIKDTGLFSGIFFLTMHANTADNALNENHITHFDDAMGEMENLKYF